MHDEHTPVVSSSSPSTIMRSARSSPSPPMASPIASGSSWERSDRYRSPRRGPSMSRSQRKLRGGVDHYSPSPTPSLEDHQRQHHRRSPPTPPSPRRRSRSRYREMGGPVGGPVAPPSRPPNAPRVDANPVLGVFGLSIRTRERDLEDEFSRFGDVEKVVIVYDQRVSTDRPSSAAPAVRADPSD